MTYPTIKTDTTRHEKKPPGLPLAIHEELEGVTAGLHQHIGSPQESLVEAV